MKELKFHNKEFENEVRAELLIFDRPLTTDDALNVYDLDCSNFTFDIEDCNTLCTFKNLDWLHICIGFEDFSFFERLENLESLFVEFYRKNFDCSYLSELKKLKTLTISGGAVSSFKFHNFENLTKLSSLESLGLHEFGSVDLSALKQMTHLKDFFCGYADNIKNIDAITYLVNLECLNLIDVTVNNFDFLNTLKKSMILELCEVDSLENFDVEKLKRFEKVDLENIRVNGDIVIKEYITHW